MMVLRGAWPSFVPPDPLAVASTFSVARVGVVQVRFTAPSLSSTRVMARSIGDTGRCCTGSSHFPTQN